MVPLTILAVSTSTKPLGSTPVMNLVAVLPSG